MVGGADTAVVMLRHSAVIVSVAAESRVGGQTILDGEDCSALALISKFFGMSWMKLAESEEQRQRQRPQVWMHSA